MKKIFFFFIYLFFFSFSFSQNNLLPYPPDSALRISKFIPLTEAEKIMGSAAYGHDSTKKFTDGYYLRFQFTYKSKKADSVTKEFSSLFFGFEQFKDAATAKHMFDLLKSENEKNSSFTPLNQIGDEGFLSKDNQGNPFIMIRKSCRAYKFRLLHAKNISSTEQLAELAKKIVLLQ